MAWTETLTDAVTGEVAQAAWGDAVNANFAASGPHLIVKKGADESVSSTTLQDDAELIAPVLANEEWLFEWRLRIVTAAADMEFQFTFPSAATAFNLAYIGRNAAGTVTDFQNQTATSPLNVGNVFVPTSNAFGFILPPFQVHYVNGANAGNVVLQWAPNTAVNMTVKARSTLWGVKLS